MQATHLSCEECSQPIQRAGATGRFPRFCSLRCERARDRHRRATQRSALTCAQCGQTFTGQRRNAAYCGQACRYRAKANREGRASVPPAEERFWSRIDKAADGCWNWTGAMLASGYGSLRVDNHAHVVHRFAWELLRGPIPDGLQVDHLCRNRRCCNPDHLEPVTQQENLRRAREAAALLRGARPDDEEQR